MAFDESIPAKRSLRSLRKVTKTKDRSPDFTGTIKIQRHTFETIAKQFSGHRFRRSRVLPCRMAKQRPQRAPISVRRNFTEIRSTPSRAIERDACGFHLT